jgi:hypothetical protein
MTRHHFKYWLPAKKLLDAGNAKLIAWPYVTGVFIVLVADKGE